jgi:hypothetical protein
MAIKREIKNNSFNQKITFDSNSEDHNNDHDKNSVDLESD